MPAQFGRGWLQDHYELTIAPPEEDLLHGTKLKILSASTLGLTHFLGPICKPARLANSWTILSERRPAFDVELPAT